MKKSRFRKQIPIFLMKVTLIFAALTISFVTVSFAKKTSGQGVLDKKVTIRLQNEGFKTALNKIARKAGITFSYTRNTIPANKSITLNVNEKSLGNVFISLFEPYNIYYEAIGNQIVLWKEGESFELANGKVDGVPFLIMQDQIKGTVRDESGNPLAGVTVQIIGGAAGTSTNERGEFEINAPSNAKLIFSFVGFEAQEVALNGRASVEVVLVRSISSLEDVVVVGYGTQKKSDITGSVASIPQDKLDMVPNINIAQAVQGAVPGVIVNTTSAGASSEQSIMIRGRNSIAASNDPLIVLDGIPYSGNLGDINVTDIKSIEILKDASSAAIYGSRASSGVILVTTKNGIDGKTRINYEGRYATQKFNKLPDLLSPGGFYEFKMERFPGAMTVSEQEVFDNKEWTNWMDLAFRNGHSQQHNLSVIGGTSKIKFFTSFDYLDVKGVTINDKYKRLTGRVNLDASITEWLDLGTRTQFGYDDMSGLSPDMIEVFEFNPLTKAFDDNGNLTILPWVSDPSFGNPLQPTLFDNRDISHQINTNNFLVLRLPFVPGLSYRFNSGIRARFADQSTYRGRDTRDGLDARGSANTFRGIANNTTIENIINYDKEFDDHKLGVTALYSYEANKTTVNKDSASRFPNDFLTYYSMAQAEFIHPTFEFDQTKLISQMFRVNYSYQNKYLATVTTRRDGFSGFGTNSKWGVFPSAAIGWNINQENFFPWQDLFTNLKLRLSWGKNGKQAAGAFSSISRMSEFDIVDRNVSAPGYIPSVLGQDNLSWETSKTLNIGIDFGILNNRITGDINLYKTNTSDLLLNRSISSVHGITSIIQNIGETQNQGIELSLNAINIKTSDFRWTTNGNLSYIKNKIVSLGQFDENGRAIDDISNNWFIGKPVNINYDFVWLGTWQESEAAEAAQWGTQPGFVKLKDNGDGQLTGEDREIIGHQDPSFLWGLTNNFSYKNFNLNIFIYGVHGVTKNNAYMSDFVWADVRRNTVVKNWWTPQNPTNDWVMNAIDADRMSGILAGYYENASFVRVKDITLSYDLPVELLERIGINKLRVYATGRNQFTFTSWSGLDPELSEQKAIPLQKELLFGLQLTF